MPSFFLGIDASKGYADFVLLDARRRLLEPAFQLDDTFEGHACLYRILHQFCQEHPEAMLWAAAESTGGYENNWLHALRRFQASLPLNVARLNPSFVRGHVEASGARITTDATSAEHIAGYLAAYPQKVHYERQDALAGLRARYRFIEQLTRQRTAHVNQFEKLLYRAHPQLVASLSGGLPAWVLKLVKAYPTARRLARARAETVSKIPYVTPERAEALIQAAKRSVASAEDAATESLLREMARQILQLGALIKAQKEVLTSQMELPEEVALLKSFGSISDYAAVGLLLEIQSVERFASAKKLVAFFGVHPSYKISGDGIGAMRMSKQGSARMRALLFMITLGAIQHNAVIAPLYERLLGKGKAKMEAIGICMHKTLRILYGLLKNRTPFDAEVDHKNQERRRPQRTGAALDSKRRFQRFDKAAPISARAKKKRRRQQKHSQGAVGTTCGMSTSTVADGNQRADNRKSLVKEQASLV